jgi:alanine racemase
VLVMGPSQHGGEDDIIACGLTPVIASADDLAAMTDAVKRRGRRVETHLKVDTGMNRLGVALAEVAELCTQAERVGVVFVGLMTHFACADVDEPSDPECMTNQQLRRFADAERVARAAGAPIRVKHAANSSGALLFAAARFDMVRTGIAIYGNGRWPDGTAHAQAMRLVTEVAQLRTIAAGDSVGYNASWRAHRTSRVAVLPLGYADGLPRRASGHAEVAIRGKRAPLVGLISMDIAIADVTEIADVALGDAAVLLGRAAGGASITTAEYGAWAGLSEYEVTCGMSKRVPRTYVGEVP